MAQTVPQQFNLRWNNHTSNILQVFLEQYTSELLVDVTLSCQGKLLKAHKMVLSACSPYFQELFNHHDNPHPIIILYGMRFDDVKAIIEFMYKGEIKVLESELDSLLEVAETLQIKGLCNVRNKYEKGEINDPEENYEAKKPKLSNNQMHWSSDGSSTDDAIEDLAEKDQELKSKVADLSSPPFSPPMLPVMKKVGRGPPAVVRVHVRNSSDYNANDDDLPAMIKVEPPDIRDIDDDSTEDWETPRLVIDLPEIPPPKTEPSKAIIARQKAKRLVLQGNPSRPKDKKLSGFESKIPRPPNAFMIFANEWRRKLAFENPGDNNKEISVRLGFMWKSLSSESKEAYYAASRQADLEHKQKYPGYYYSPKEARLRKRLKKRNTSATIEAMELVRVLMKEDSNNLQAQTSHD